MDVRMINFYKFHVPKTESFVDIFDAKCIQESSHNYYFTTGHYDVIDIVKLNFSSQSANHKLYDLHSYAKKNVLPDNCEKALEDAILYKLSRQKQLVFTDYKENCAPEYKEYFFSEQEIEEFWRKDISHGTNDGNKEVLFVTMMHINDSDADYPGNRRIKILDVLKSLKQYYNGLQYRFYFTFDYSDIIIFCKTNDIGKYVEYVIDSNYYKCQDETVTQYIRDSFSFYGICRSFMLEKFKQLDAALKFNEDELSVECNEKFLEFQNVDAKPKFNLEFNIGVQSGDILKSFNKALEFGGKILNYKFEIINQLGRHDFNITTSEATLDWFVYVEWLINHYTTVDESKVNGKINKDTVFRTFEAFVGGKVCLDKNTVKTQTYADIINIEFLSNKVDALCQSLERYGFSSYCLPIQEVQNSIFSIVKNKFAEDFIICMYESFVRFVDLLSVNIEAYSTHSTENEKVKDKIHEIFNAYFMGINALANSAMHSNRSFIQATDFNAIFYDVPPKLMAYYTAVLHKMVKILRDEDESNYAFLFTPDFSTEITVKSISKNPEPSDRVLLASINETFFYNPTMVISTTAHEAAHFAGDKNRMRQLRMKYYIKILVYKILNEILPKDIDVTRKINELASKISDAIVEREFKKMTSSEFYSYNMNKMIGVVCAHLKNNPQIRDCMLLYFRKLNIKNIAEYPVVNIGVWLYDNAISKIDDYIKGLQYADSFIMGAMANVRSVFSEAYADMQMIILLGLSYKDYIDKLRNEKIDSNQIARTRHLMRITLITVLMRMTGQWDNYPTGTGKIEAETKACIFEIEKNVKNFTVILQAMKNYDEVNRSLRQHYISFLKKLGEEPNVNDIIEKINDVKVEDLEISKYYDYIQIFSYLKKSMEISLSMPESKVIDIKALRKSYLCIKSFNNVKDVYTCIRREIEDYKCELIEIS